jgi:isopenicillin-N epimerase
MDPWILDPAIAQLNHGSFGACSAPVLEAQRRWRTRMEANPTAFFVETVPEALDHARTVLGGFLGGDPDGMAFVANATTGVNAVLRSLEPDLGTGDEIVVIDHAYNACRNAVEATARRTGFSVVVATIPFPIAGPDEVVTAVLDAVSSRTRLVMIDHVTSATALVLPLARIVSALEPDVPVLVDGAHAPGMVPVALDELGAAFYAGNCHKWLCAPKGAGFLHVREDQRHRIEPVVVSHGWEGEFPPARSRYQRMFDWTGTDDPTARLVIPDALEAVGNLHPGGWPGVMAANRDLALAARDLICAALDLEPAAPPEMIGAMATVPLGEIPDPAPLPDPLIATLRSRWSIEIPVFAIPSPTRRAVRLSAQRYNRLDDYALLAEALVAEAAVTGR